MSDTERSSHDRSEKPRSFGAKALRFVRDIALMLVIVLVVSHFMGSFRAPDLPDQAPGFALVDVEGKALRLEDFKGKRVVLNFWATWCTPCRIEAPAFSRWAERNPDAILLGIAADGTDEELKTAAKDLGIRYRIARGHPELFKAYGVNTYPTTVLIGPDGEVVAAHTGLLTDPQLAWFARER